MSQQMLKKVYESKSGNKIYNIEKLSNRNSSVNQQSWLTLFVHLCTGTT